MVIPSSHQLLNTDTHSTLGPRSCLSLCSQSGIEWIESKTGTSGFRRSAQIFISDITRRLKLAKGLSRNRTPDPDRESARKYTAGIVVAQIMFRMETH